MRPKTLFLAAVIIASLCFNVVAYVKFRHRRPILRVNGESVSKQDIDDFLEQKNPGVKAIMVERRLIEQEAIKLNVWPSDKEVQDRFDERKELEWQFARSVANPWMEAEAKNEIRTQLAQMQIQAKDVPVDDAMLREEYEVNKGAYDTPDKARVNLCLVMRKTPVNDVKAMLEKTPQMAPAEIARTYPQQVIFMGDRDVFTFIRTFGQKAPSPEIEALFAMKPGEVKEFRAQELQQFGAQTMLVRMAEVIPGKVADQNDPKTKEKLRLGAAARRAKPWQEILARLWNSCDFWSEIPEDRNAIEAVFFPDRAAASAPKQ